jgi:hypothetical protein
MMNSDLHAVIVILQLTHDTIQSGGHSQASPVTG